MLFSDHFIKLNVQASKRTVYSSKKLETSDIVKVGWLNSWKAKQILFHFKNEKKRFDQNFKEVKRQIKMNFRE